MVQLQVQGAGDRGLVRNYLLFAVIIATVLGVALAFTPLDAWLETIGIVGLVAANIAALRFPVARRFVLRHRRAVLALAVGLLAITPMVIFGDLSASSEFRSSVAALLFMAGSLLILLPFAAKRAEKDVTVWEATEAVAAGDKPASVSAVGDIRATITELLHHKGALVRVVGPWLLLACLPALAFVDLDYWKEIAGRDRSTAANVLLGLLLVILVDVAIVMVALIQWTRFIGTKREPRLTALPARALWGWTWRLMVSGVMLEVVDGLGPWLTARFPAAVPWQIDGAERLAAFVAILLISPVALALPAVALGAADRALAASTQALVDAGQKFYLTVALILAPQALASWGLGVLYAHYKAPAAVAANIGASVLLSLLTMIVGVTYLTRIYLRGTATTEAGEGQA